MTTAVYPGSFDPVHRGHLDIVERARQIFDRVVVGVLENPGKRYLFDADERVALLRASLGADSAVAVRPFQGLAVRFAVEEGATVIVRGLRAVSDLDNEFQMSLMNRRLEPSVHTVFLTTSFGNVFLSSSLLKEVCAFGGRIDEMVSAPVAEALRERLGSRAPAPS